MECNEIRDILPDFYLGNLPPDETEAVERHLAEHPGCREALEEVSGVLDLLHLDAPPLAPPPELKGRVLARISAENNTRESRQLPKSREASPAPSRRGHRRSGPVPGRASARSGALTRNLLAAGLVVALLSLVGVGLLYADLASENEQLRQEVAALNAQEGEGGGNSGMVAVPLSDTGQAPGAAGMLVLDPQAGQVALGVYSLPQPAQGSEYRVWLIPENGEPVGLGTMKTNSSGDGQMEGELPEAQAGAYERLEVTSEPEGSNEKSNDVYLRADLSGSV